MPTNETITLWQVTTAVLLPVVVAGFWLVWGRIDKTAAVDKADRDDLWSAVNVQREAHAAYRVECERRFARGEDLKMLEEKIENRFDKLDEKLDRVLHAQVQDRL